MRSGAVVYQPGPVRVGDGPVRHCRGPSRSCHTPRPVTRIVRLLVVALIAGLLLGTNLPAVTRAADGPTTSELRAAETKVLRLINVERDKVGLRAIRNDTRIRAVAEARSQDMVDRDYFDHQDPDGKWPWDHLNDAHIGWYVAGEIIAWNMSSPVSASAETAIGQWMHSSGHKAQILEHPAQLRRCRGGCGRWPHVSGRSTSSRDPTGRTRTRRCGRRRVPTGSRSIHLDWSGSDPRLATLTAGLRSYDVARRRPGGTWSIIRSGKTGTSLTMRATKGARYQFRVRARDAAGNVGDWSDTRSVTAR